MLYMNSSNSEIKLKTAHAIFTLLFKTLIYGPWVGISRYTHSNSSDCDDVVKVSTTLNNGTFVRKNN